MFGRVLGIVFGRGKSNQACANELIQSLKEDRISQLPDSLICQILSHLPTDDAVRTSILSTRWTSLWLWVPILHLNSGEFPDFISFVSFGDKVFDSSRVSCIHKLKLTIDDRDISEDDASYLKSWIDASYLKSWINSAIKRNIQHLDVKGPRQCHCEMPLGIYSCETLVSLKLFEVSLNDVLYVSFPCLKTMHLYLVWFSNDATFERLVSCCPVLEILQIIGFENTPKVYRVHSRSLMRLSFRRDSFYEFDFVPGVVIDAPLLSYLKISDQVSKSFIVNNLELNAELDISLNFGLEGYDEASVSSGRSRIRSFLAGLSKVGDMKIQENTIKIIHHYSKSEPLPQFGYMSRLCISLHTPDLKLLPTFLESCPNLKSLVLVHPGNYQYEEPHSEEMNQISFSSMPKCLLSSLEFVDCKVQIPVLAPEMKLLRYLLKNSAILKKLTLRLDSCSKKDEILKILLKFPRGSTKCELVIL